MLYCLIQHSEVVSWLKRKSHWFDSSYHLILVWSYLIDNAELFWLEIVFLDLSFISLLWLASDFHDYLLTRCTCKCWKLTNLSYRIILKLTFLSWFLDFYENLKKNFNLQLESNTSHCTKTNFILQFSISKSVQN